MQHADTRQEEKRTEYSVSEVTRIVKAAVEGNVAPLWVVGEISNLARPRSGHLYMTLKDSGSQLAAVMWRTRAQRLRFEIEDGLEVRAFGRVTVYEPRGQYQIVLDKIEPKGVGALELAFRQLHDRLQKEGLFDAARKKPIPFLPRAVGIVTSPTGAAIEDMLNVIHTRFPKTHVILHPVRVQGDGAARQIAAAIRDFNRQANVEVMIVGRGGGSLEDLWAFNEEIVARAIFDSAIPVISAVGHEIDVSISDLVADLRALTPTDAGQQVVPIYDELIETLRAHLDDMKRALTHRLRSARQRIELLGKRRVLADPLGPIQQVQQRVDELHGRTRSALGFVARHSRQRLEACAQRLKTPDALLREIRNRLDALGGSMTNAIAGRATTTRGRVSVARGKLDSLSPLAVLARGYSITTRADDGRALTRAGDAAPGTVLLTRLHKGSLRSNVTEKTDDEEKNDEEI